MPHATFHDPSTFGEYAPRGLVARLLRASRRCSTSWSGKRTAFALRAVAVRLLRGRPLDVDAFGARMRLYPYNNTCEKRILFTPQFFDAEERELIASRITDDFVFLDIGANVGGYALAVAALAGARARILAIEPQPDLFRRLAYNIRLNGFHSLTALECAVADQPGELRLFINTKNRGETSIYAQASDQSGGELQVLAKPLLDIIREAGFEHVSAMKLDVEGAEELVLRPFFQTAPARFWPNLLAVEQSAGRGGGDATQTITERGYKAVLRTRNNIIYERA